jgi:hypothetical protein
MGNAPCSQVRHLYASGGGNGRVTLKWDKPADKGSGKGRPYGYHIDIAVDAASLAAYNHAHNAYVPQAGHRPLSRNEAAEHAAAAVKTKEVTIRNNQAVHVDAPGNPPEVTYTPQRACH